MRKIAEEVEALAEEKKMQRKAQSQAAKKRRQREILTGLLGGELKISFTGKVSLQVTVIRNKNHVQ